MKCKAIQIEDMDSVLRSARAFTEDWGENEGKHDPMCDAACAALERARPMIEAAPDMYEALRELVATNDERPSAPCREEAERKAHAALAKAGFDEAEERQIAEGRAYIAKHGLIRGYP